jgi:hypothetical protein
LVDPDGNQYDLAINHDDKTIIVKAYYLADERSYKSAVQAVNYWNGQSDKYSYVVKNNNGPEMRYKVKFELEAVKQNEFDLDKHKSTNTNIYRVVDDNNLSSDRNGESYINSIRVKESRKKNQLELMRLDIL